MGLFGRTPIPGDTDIRKLSDTDGIRDRVIRAQVQTVDPTNGFVTLVYETLPSAGHYATVPPLWMSFPSELKSSGPSWGRYMPQETDIVNIEFGYDDAPKIIGYDIIAGKDGHADGKAGWPQLNDQHHASKSSSDAKQAKFSQFVPLNPGEYDFMSSGGAYIYGNNKGRLYLAGGSVSVTLMKNDMRVSQRAQLSTITADDSEFRFGQVRRVDQTTQAEAAVQDNEDKKEFSVKIRRSEMLPMDISSFEIGDIFTDDGQPVKIESVETGSDTKSLRITYDPDGQEVFREEVDDKGNWVVMSTAGDDVRGGYLKFSNFTVDSDKILLGGSNSMSNDSVEQNPILLTSEYGPAETEVISALSQQIQQLASQLNQLATIVSAGNSSPSGGPLIFVPPTFATTIAAATQAISSNVSQAEQKFNNNYDNYKSKTTFTK